MPGSIEHKQAKTLYHSHQTTMKTTLLILFSLLALPVWAMEDTPANRSKQADRYMQATPPKELFKDMAEQMSKNMPAERREQFKLVLEKFLDVEALTKVIKEAMVKDFSADELKALADFYGSPVGKSAMKKFGTYMKDVMPGINAEMMKAKEKADEAQK